MAIEEQDREDLLRDGRTMSVRGQTEIDDRTVLIGFRERGQVSIYVGSDPVFQFDQAHQLRRAFIDGRRLAAQQGKLVELVRESRGGRVQLSRLETSDEDSRAILRRVDVCCQAIRDRLQSDRCEWEVVGIEPDEFQMRVAAWLAKLRSSVEIGSGPSA